MKCTFLSEALGYIKVLHIEPYTTGKKKNNLPEYDMKLVIVYTSSVYNKVYFSYKQFILINYNDYRDYYLTSDGITSITSRVKLDLDNCIEEYSYEIDDYIISINHKNKKAIFYYKPLKTKYCRDISTIKYQNTNYNGLDIDIINHDLVYNNDKIIIEKCDFISIGTKLFYMSSDNFSIYIVKRLKYPGNHDIFNSIDIYYVKDDNDQEKRFISKYFNMNR